MRGLDVPVIIASFLERNRSAIPNLDIHRISAKVVAGGWTFIALSALIY
jgi:hypothetical protein